MTEELNLDQQFANRREQESGFTDENWMIRVNNELHSRYEPVEGGLENLSVEDRKLLEEARDYYQRIGDTFNLFRWELKVGNIDQAKKIAEEFLREEQEPDFYDHYTSRLEEMKKANILELKKAYVVSDLARVEKNRVKRDQLRQEATQKFIKYAEEQTIQEELSRCEASALGYQQAWSLLPRGEREPIGQKCIEQFRKVVQDRAKVGDRWWESIALRQIGKISPDPEDRKIALQRAEELIQEYIQMGDYKKAALWARDIVDLNDQVGVKSSKEQIERMESLWQTNIEKMQTSGDTRDIGKSFWQLWKRAKKHMPEKVEEYRLETLKWYKQLLEESKAAGNAVRIRECYWVFSELIK